MSNLRKLSFYYSHSGRPAVGLKVTGADILGANSKKAEIYEDVHDLDDLKEADYRWEWMEPFYYRTFYTDSEGYGGEIPEGWLIYLSRGDFKFPRALEVPSGSGPYRFDIEYNWWPHTLRRLREKIIEFKSEFVEAANAVLYAFQESTFIDQLTDINNFNGEPPLENPHIVANALLIPLLVSRFFTFEQLRNTPSGYGPSYFNKYYNEQYAINSGIDGILKWIDARRHPDCNGYFFRWAQENLDSRSGRDWAAEPSLDEYSGLLMGLRWLYSLGHYPPWREGENRSEFGRNELRKIFENYFWPHNGWLVRPKTHDLVVRGPDLPLNAFPIYCIFKGLVDIPTLKLYPLEFTDSIRTYLANSEANLRDLRDDDECAKAAGHYQTTLKLLQDWRHYTDEIKFWEWLAKTVGFGTSTFPLAIGAIILGDYIDKKIKDLNFIQGWGIFGEALGAKVGFDAGGYNTHIFDRFSLAAFWGNIVYQDCLTQMGTPFSFYSPNWAVIRGCGEIPNSFFDSHNLIENSFKARSTRRVGGDAIGWQSFGIASRIWFGTVFSDPALTYGNLDLNEVENALNELIRRFLENIHAKIPKEYTPLETLKAGSTGSMSITETDTPGLIIASRDPLVINPDLHLPDVSLQNIEGFVLGWALICLSLDLDPEFKWIDKIKVRYQESVPRELAPFRPPRLPRIEKDSSDVTVKMKGNDRIRLEEIPNTHRERSPQ